MQVLIRRSWRIVIRRLLPGSLCALLAVQLLTAQTLIRTAKVLGSKDAVEVEVEASDRIVPETQVLTGPDRLVIDFPNALPSHQLRNQSIDQGEVKDLRFGLFQNQPPVTRIVLDLKSPQSYQVFPYGRTVMIKVTGGSSQADSLAVNQAPQAGLVAANYTGRAEPVRVEPVVKSMLDVSFQNGLLGIRANQVSLGEILFLVRQRTGAAISLPPGAEQEKVAAEIAPAPAPEVLARLLNGSRFNFLILSAANDPRQLDRVILTPRPDAAAMPLPPMQNLDSNDAAPPPLPPQATGAPAQVMQVPPNSQPEMKAPDNPPDQ